MGSRPLRGRSVALVSQEAAVRGGSFPSAARRLASAALARLHHHVGQLLHLGGPADVVEDGQGLQVLRHTAW